MCLHAPIEKIRYTANMEHVWDIQIVPFHYLEDHKEKNTLLVET